MQKSTHPLVPLRTGGPGHSPGGLGYLQQLADILIAQGVFYLSATIKLGGEFPDTYLTLAGVMALSMMAVYQWSGVYHALRLSSLWLEARGLFKAWVYMTLALFALGFATKTGHLYSREALFWWVVFGFLGQFLFHGLFRVLLRRLRRRGYNVKRTLLVGSGAGARQFLNTLERNPWLGHQILGYVCDQEWKDDEPAEGAPGKDSPEKAPEPRHLGGLGRLREVIENNRVEMVYITFPMEQSRLLEKTVNSLVPLPVSVHWVPDITSLHILGHSVREIEGQPVFSISDVPIYGLQRLGKWLLDKLFSLTVLILLSPLLLLIALAIKLSSPGPVLFRQARTGLNGKPFNVFKFRTMVLHAESSGQVTQARREDPRLTSIGGFLRSTSLDELPQFFNVLLGHMSIVGPRPHALEHDDYYQRQIGNYMLRHRIKPGITGWAQVSGYRGETEQLEKMASRVKHDLYYINNWTLGFDIVIILMTAWVVLTGRNAY
ncbi:MAG: undecaprenyl-phosphate glucose phosphotransferase [Deltaproteobacteria bacterium]|nr:undecaprenyl-phosphate glucose phosphotransferase [Deltaproteobacteria bacterium]